MLEEIVNSNLIEEKRKEQKKGYLRMGMLTGLAPATVRNVYKGEKNITLGSLLAVLEELGLELEIREKEGVIPTSYANSKRGDGNAMLTKKRAKKMPVPLAR